MTIRNIAHRARRAVQGVTLVELLVVLLIISLLATAAVPVFLNRIEDARRSVARQEVEEIAKAQQMVGIYHGVYVPLQMLDDLPSDFEGSALSNVDDVRNSSAGSFFLIQTALDARTQQTDGQQRLVVNSALNPLGERVLLNWKGPFINYQRVWTNGKPNDLIELQPSEIRNRHPLDPWGAPYRFYSPIGIIGARANDSTVDAYNDASFSDGRLPSPSSSPFDRYAIVSFGPDGLAPRATSDSSDNIVYVFGTDGSESTFSF